MRKVALFIWLQNDALTFSSPLPPPSPPQTLKKAYRVRSKPERTAPGSALIVTERDRGVRLITLCGDSTNALDVPLLRALRATLERFERNPAITMIVLTGRDSGIFSSGIDARKLALAAAEGPAAAAAALEELRESYALASLIATYTKPIVATLDGIASGSGWALGAHSEYSYATPRTAVVFPETRDGHIPNGGASYHLSRLGGGRGTWLALTGAVLEGEDAYWAGATQLWGASTGTPKNIARTVLSEAGALSRSGASEHVPLANDPIYIKALELRRSYRSEGAMEQLSNERSGEELDNDTFEEYVRLKRWYSFLVVGDRASADAALGNSDEYDEMGDLFYAGQRREDFGGPTDGERAQGSYSNEPFAVQEARRARMGATSAHAASVFAGALSDGPSKRLTERLSLVQEAFAGSEKGKVTPKVITSAAATPSGAATGTSTAFVSRVSVEPLPEELAAAASARVIETHRRIATTVLTALPASWETTLAKAPTPTTTTTTTAVPNRPRIGKPSSSSLVTLDDVIIASASRLNIRLPDFTPTTATQTSTQSSSLPPPDLLRAMVRLSVSAAWPTGALDARNADAIIVRFLKGGAAGETPGGAKGRADISKLLRVAAARATASIHALPDWTLLDERAVGLERSSTSPTRNKNSLLAEDDDVAASIALHSTVATLRDPVLEGPSPSFWVPPVPTTLSGGGSDDAYLSITPRLASDPDALWYDAVEEDFLYPFTEGHWSGDKDFMGSKDSFLIFPTGSWAPAAEAQPAARAAAVARADMVRLVALALHDPTAYAAPAIAHARATPAQAQAVRSRLFGTPGETAFKAVLARYEAKEGPTDNSLEPTGERALRARATLVWPQLLARIAAARAIVYSGMAAVGNITLRAADSAALAEVGVETAEGYAILASAASGGHAEASRLIKLWDTIITAATPASKVLVPAVRPPPPSTTRLPFGKPFAAAATSNDATTLDGDADVPPPSPPSVNLSPADKEALRQLAASFAAWESVWLGSATGGIWIRSGSGVTTTASSTYALAETRDGETGRMRITLALRSETPEVALTKGSPPASIGAARRAILKAGEIKINTYSGGGGGGGGGVGSGPLGHLWSSQSGGQKSSSSSITSAAAADVSSETTGDDDTTSSGLPPLFLHHFSLNLQPRPLPCVSPLGITMQ